MKSLTTIAAAAACLALVLAAGCAGHRACRRPGYDLRVLEADGRPAADAIVIFQTFELSPEGEPTVEAGPEVTAAADGQGRVVIGPQRQKTVKGGKRKLGTLIRVELPDGRRAETVHPLPKKVKCNLLEVTPIVLEPET